MNRSLAFFDVDTREPDPGRGGLRFRERVEPIQAKLETLLNLADEAGHSGGDQRLRKCGLDRCPYP